MLFRRTHRRQLNGLRIWVIGLALVAASAHGKDTLTIAVNPSSATQQELYHLLAKRFETMHPNVHVVVSSQSLEAHKDRVREFYQGKEAEFDVIFAYAGTQLNAMIDAGQIAPLTGIWQSQTLDSQYTTTSKQVVSRQGEIYAVPTAYYSWGVYYRKSMFSQWQVNIPQTWQQWLDLIVQLRKEGVTPLNFTGQSPWSTLAWFDYLTLRLFGIEKYRALMSGSEPFDQASVRQVIDHLDQLIQAKAFDPKHQSLTWQEALPFFYRGRIAMMLNGNFFLAHVPADVREDIGFFPFPNLVSAMPRYENAPTDIAALALQAKNKPHALAFMVFLTSFEAQQMIARYVGKISPHRLFEPDDQYLLAQGKLHLQNAAGVVQYFDRETNADFSAAAGDILVDFMAQRISTEQVIAALEQARKDFLKTKDTKIPFAITSH